MRLNIFGFGAKDVAAQSGALTPGEQNPIESQVKGGDSESASAARKSGARSSGSKVAGKAKSTAKITMPPATTDSLKKRVKWLLSRLESFRQRMEPALESGDSAALTSAMNEFFDFVHTYGDSVAYDAFEIGPAFPEYHELFKRASLEFVRNLEDRAFAEIIEASLEPGQRLKDLMSDHVRGAYAQMDELTSLVNMNQFRSIVVLGCGKVPSGLFYLYDQTAIPAIVGINGTAQAVEDSNTLLRKFNLERVRVIESDAVNLDFSFFDAVYFGPFVPQRKDVMKRIRATARPNATIIVRDPILTGSMAMEKVLPFMEPAFTLIKSGDPVKYRGPFMLRHFILQPR
jgi:hypothetical protein